MADVIVIGGGLAGLFNALLLNRAGLKVTVIEKKTYPFHRVCGEYLSNELLPLLSELNIDVFALGAKCINRVMITATSGAQFSHQLDLGGFGISRYTLDHHLYQLCLAEGVEFKLSTTVNDIQFNGNSFHVFTPQETLTAPLTIGAFGKRSNLDHKLNRAFFFKRSPYVGIKTHVRLDFPDDVIQLNTFSNGYCGISKIEGDRYCMCAIAHRNDLRQQGSLEALQQNVISQNPYQREIYRRAEVLMDKPEVINEISFLKKQPVENHILMSGDTAGMIAPLCGNGMAMAIHSACILSALIIRHYRPGGAFTLKMRKQLEHGYQSDWNQHFARRLWVGRRLQHLFGNQTLMHCAIKLLQTVPAASKMVMRQTHGKAILSFTGN